MQARRILVIDNDPQSCELVTTALTGDGFEVLLAPDGPRGIELALEAKPTVVLLDMLLPGTDGIRTCQQLKQHALLAAAVVVAVTASPELRYIEQMFRAGAEFFLMKPFEAEKLVQVVESAVQRAQVGGCRRTHPRFPVQVPVRCLVKKVVGKAVNASIGGLKLDLVKKLAPGTKIRLQIKLPAGMVTAEAQVMWQDDEVNNRNVRYIHGVQILSFVEDSGFLQYKRFLKEIAAASPA